ncbi:hypothetical protein JYT89_00850 [Flavobacteriaceae bacterium AH-315-B10]|nr:hypothetical protein [Flavobacteriaceae bacterium AH-315-B10]
MIKENKVSKYMLYAIGEILLVVIGIVIALQINNWNENRKKNIEDTKALISLNNEIIKNQEELTATIEDHKFVFEKVDELSKLMHPNPKEIEIAKLDTLMYAMINLPKFNPITTILSSDKIEGIKDEKLKNKIASWKYVYDNYEYSIKITYDLYYNYIYEFLSENYQMKNIKGRKFISDQSLFDIDVHSILSNSVFENQVTMRSVNAKLIHDRATKLYDIQKSTIEYLELKLGEKIQN